MNSVDEPVLFVNTGRVRETAAYFDKHGVYTHFPKGTKKWLEFWQEEKRRSIEGYSTPEGDLHVTGYHYFYLNFCRMRRVVEKETHDGDIVYERRENFPLFYDEDHYYFWKLDEARKTNKHMVVLKARRKGFSYKAAAMLCRNYFMLRKSKNFVYAGLKEHLVGDDAILPKVWDMLNFIDQHTAYTQPRLKNGPLSKVSGYQEKASGTFIQKGTQNSISGVSLKDDPDKVRGKGAELIFYEEAGDLPELLAAWNRAMPSMKQGNRTLGLMIAFGTGGTEGTGFEGLNELFYNPNAYDILEFDNVWSEGAYGTKCGYFCPIYKILEGFIDEHGNSQVEAALEFERLERDKKRSGADPKSYDSYLAENPWTPEEATLQSSHNLFNLAMIKAQLDRVRTHNLTNLATPGKLFHDADGIVKFKADFDLKPIFKFPHTKKDDVTGCVVMWEPPYRVKGEVPNFLYVICHDPYGQDKAQTRSLGSAYVIKRVNPFSHPDDVIVASYVGRPQSQDDYNSNLMMLAQYYNAKVGFENDRGEVIPFFQRKKKLHLLQEEFEMLHKKELGSKEVKRNYGMHMTPQRKLQGEIYIRDWVEAPRGKGLDGNHTLNIHKVYDPALLEELLKFNQTGNFDRVMSLMIGMYHMKELTHAEVAAPNSDRASDDFFDRLYTGQTAASLPVDDGEFYGDDEGFGEWLQKMT